MGIMDFLFGKKNRIMNREEFRQEILTKLKTVPNLTSIASSNEFFGFIASYQGDDREIQIHLNNHYRAYSNEQTDQGRKDVIEGCFQNFSVNSFYSKIDKSCVFPLVRPIGFFGENAESVWAAINGGEPLPDDYDGPFVRPLIADLVLVLANENELSWQTVSKSDLDEIGVSVDMAWEAAFQNILSDRFSTSFRQIDQTPLCVFQIENESWLTPTLLLFPSIFHKFMSANNIASAYISLPDREGVLFVDDGIKGAFSLISAFTKQLHKSEVCPQSDQIFRVRLGQDDLEWIQNGRG